MSASAGGRPFTVIAQPQNDVRLIVMMHAAKRVRRERRDLTGTVSECFGACARIVSCCRRTRRGSAILNDARVVVTMRTATPAVRRTHARGEQQALCLR